ncbi:OB-fold nucleic acid binding domain-containing protein [Methanobacterium alcaliphilum]|uniref:OB-fold nucleic acid binding domain-containing protein n=1 Tax=Methanobacterium alcaliphilum TaxID=392018 RepID=UPI002009E9F2|nr:OB-fold nucleic acid binding domain-containing protein [Methanobacterium alcaliphilum]MCK9151104.1 OB-fold nucleic acid binding domain-containing protein [Methanobacterium alcaliphilum]
MNEEIMQEYQKVKDKISEEEFLEKMNEMKKDYEDVSFMNDIDIARMIVGQHVTEKNTPLSQKKEHSMDKISKMEEGADKLKIIGRVMRISNPKKFTSRKGKDGKVANLVLADETEEVRIVFWTENIKLLKKIKEGDVIEIDGGDVKEGYRGRKEIHLKPRSTIEVLDEDTDNAFPDYKEEITPIGSIEEDQEVNIIARIVRVPRIRTFDKDGKDGKVASLEIKDETGQVSYTLWNRDTELIADLDLNEGDAIKVLGAQSKLRNGEISLTHPFVGRIIKGDYDVPDIEEKVFKIGDAHEEKDVTVMGLVTKVQDAITFERSDGSSGSVRSIEIADDTGSIRVTLWNDDTTLEINKGDIVKILGGNIEFDEYAASGYRINTTWNTRIMINPESDGNLLEVLQEYKKHLEPVKIGTISDMEDEGEEIDVVGRVVSINDPREFQREDGTVGLVRSADLADESGVVRISLWDEKAHTNIQIGEPVRIENARTKLGLYSVDLSVGKTSRIMDPNEEDMKDLPSFEELEEMIFTTKKIDELEEDDRNVRIIGRIIDIYDPNEFQRDDGSRGLVRSLELGDDTGAMRASLWDEKAEIPLNIGDAIRIENPRVTFRNDNLELSVGRNTQLGPAKDKDLDALPTFKELEDMIFQSRKIEELDEDDRNIKVSGDLTDAFGGRILSYRCPNCNNRLESIEEEYICDFCGETAEEPRYLLMLPARLADDTGEIRVTFFGKQAEQLLGMTTPEVADIIAKSADEGALEDKVEDLNGVHITVIGDAKFDEYNEELRLNPKKIIEVEL